MVLQPGEVNLRPAQIHFAGDNGQPLEGGRLDAPAQVLLTQQCAVAARPFGLLEAHAAGGVGLGVDVHQQHTLAEDGEAVATARFIGPGPAGHKSLNDTSRPPWGIDGQRSARSAGVDLDKTWDIATVAVRPGHGRGGLCAAALYHGIVAAAFTNDIEYVVMIMDSHARRLLSGLGMQTQVLPATSTGEYLGSESSTPLWANLHRMFERQRQDDPDAYRLIFQGVGLDGIEQIGRAHV